MTTRRTLMGSAIAAASAVRAQVAEGQPPLAADLVKDFVGKSHTDLAAVKAMLKQEPRLVTASWDWGAGDWETGLNAASHMGRHDIAETLIAGGARVDTPTVFMMGMEPLAKTMLLSFTALHKIPGAHGIPLLSHAIVGKSMPVFRLLIGAGADVNKQAWRGGTPLLSAVATDQAEMVRMLLREGAQRNEKVLEMAKKRNVPEIVALIEKG